MLVPSLPRLLAFGLLAALVVSPTASCGGGGDATGTTATQPETVAQVILTPATALFSVGATQQLSVVTKDAAGNTLIGRTVTWASLNPSIAGVTAGGLVTGNSAGSATITAWSEGKTAAATITVVSAPVASLTIAPATTTVTVGATQQLSVVTKDAFGNTLAGRTVTWSSSNPSVATVTGSLGIGTGIIATGVAAGSATITASSEGKTGTATMTVTPLPAGLTVSVSTPTIMWQNYVSPVQTVTITRAPGITGPVRLKASTSHPGIAVIFPTTNPIATPGILAGETTAQLYITTTGQVPTENQQVTITAENDQTQPVTTTLSFTPRSSVYSGEFFNLQHQVSLALGADVCLFNRSINGKVSFSYPSTVTGTRTTMTVDLSITATPVQTKVGSTICQADQGDFTGSTTFDSAYPVMVGSVSILGGGTYQFIYNGFVDVIGGRLGAGTVDIKYSSMSAVAWTQPVFPGKLVLLREGQLPSP